MHCCVFIGRYKIILIVFVNVLINNYNSSCEETDNNSYNNIKHVLKVYKNMKYKVYIKYGNFCIYIKLPLKANIIRLIIILYSEYLQSQPHKNAQTESMCVSLCVFMCTKS